MAVVTRATAAKAAAAKAVAAANTGAAAAAAVAWGGGRPTQHRVPGSSRRSAADAAKEEGDLRAATALGLGRRPQLSPQRVLPGTAVRRPDGPSVAHRPPLAAVRVPRWRARSMRFGQPRAACITTTTTTTTTIITTTTMPFRAVSSQAKGSSGSGGGGDGEVSGPLEPKSRFNLNLGAEKVSWTEAAHAPGARGGEGKGEVEEGATAAAATAAAAAAAAATSTAAAAGATAAAATTSTAPVHTNGIIDGRAIAAQVIAQVKAEVAAAAAAVGRAPRLGVVLVGDRPDSAKYVALKQAAAAEAGIATSDRRLPADASQAEVLAAVRSLENDPFVDGVLVQLPLPEHVDQGAVLAAVSADKDVDGFHPQNLGALARLGEEYRRAYHDRETQSSQGHTHQRRGGGDNALPGSLGLNYPPLPLNGSLSGGGLNGSLSHGPNGSLSHGLNAPCTALGCVEILDRCGVDLCGKHVVVVGRSNIVGLPAALLSLHRDATVTVCHVRTPQTRQCAWEAEPVRDHRQRPEDEPTRLGTLCRLADVLIVAAGHPKLIPGHWVKPGAVVLDVGFNAVTSAGEEEEGASTTTICGDVCFDTARERASLITPVPGGVGPMTIAMLMRNTLSSFLFRNKHLTRGGSGGAAAKD